MFDLLISGCLLYDGSGAPPVTADVAVSGERLAAIGQLRGEPAKRSIHLQGRALAPGFVDVHSHSDYYLLVNPLAESKIRQGVTTEIGGNCGYAAAPITGPAFEERRRSYRQAYGLELAEEGLSSYFARLEATGLSVNFGLLVGHNTVRASVMGGEDRPPTQEELRGMGHLVEAGMAEGALGLSTGLIYPPACFASMPELVALCRIVAGQGGIFTSHMRSEGEGLLEAIAETLQIGREAELPVQISHLKTSGRENWSKLDQALELIEQAQGQGIDVACDRYPYIASNTGLQVLLPDWVLAGGVEQALQRLRDRALRGELRRWLEGRYAATYWQKVLISLVSTDANKRLEGKSVQQAALLRGQAPVEVILDLLLEERTQVEVILFTMSEKNLRRILPLPYVQIASDAGAKADYGPLAAGLPHPRAFGTFPRVLGRYCRDERLLDLPTAIRKMTADPCRRFGIRGRGLLRPGYFADLVVFDPATINDEATFTDPKRYPQGIDYVIVNGQITVAEGRHLGTRAGRIIKRGEQG